MGMDELCEQSAAMTAEIVEAAMEVAKESAQSVARLLGLAFEELKQIDVDAISEDIINALEEMQENGTEIAEDIMKQIGLRLGEAMKYLSDIDVQQLYDDIGKAAAAQLAGFMIFWEQMQDFMETAIEEGRELVKAALPVLSVAACVAEGVMDDVGEHVKEGANVAAEVMEDVSGQIKDTTQGACLMVKDIYNSSELQDVVGETFEGIEDAYTQSRETIHAAMKALAGIGFSGCAASCPLLQIEIARDFAQTISLFFNNLYTDITNSPWLESAKSFFGGVANFIAIDVAAAFQSEEMVTIGLIILVVAIILAYSMYLWFVFHAANVHNRANEIRDGHEAQSWSEVAAQKQRTVKFTTYAITACMSVYLPVARLCFELISEKKDAFLVKKLTGLSENNQEIQIGKHISIFLLMTFTIPLPIVLFFLIQQNKPAGSPGNPDITYDIDGEQIEFDDKIYNQLILQDPNQQKCPYRSLYQGLERRWAYYKVVQLVFKLLLVISLILLAEQAQAWVSLIIYGTLAGLSFYTSPFIDPNNDAMDSSGRITGLITCLGGALLVTFSTSGSLSQTIGFFINIANGVNFLIMGSTFLLGNKTFKTKIKNARGKFLFCDSVQDIADCTAEEIVPMWDLDRECKHRIWHTFWEGMLLNKCGETVAQRLMELKDATTNSGIENIKLHWEGQSDPQMAAMRLHCQQHLEGVDIYWDDVTGCRDGVLDSKTCFGKLYIHPYPFHCVVVYDDAKDESFIRQDKFEAFYKLNTNSEVMQKRVVRQKIRALDQWGGHIDYPFDRLETETVQDGTKSESYTDSEGNEQTRQVANYSTVSFTCYYSRGVITVGAESKKRMAAGFNVSMTYTDGHGQATLPNTGQLHHFNNRCAVMGHVHIELNGAMEESETLTMIFNQTQNALDTYLPALLNQHNEYRQEMIQKHLDANRILGDGFWYFVFNNATLSQESLISYLQTQEGNEIMRAIPTQQIPALNFLYRRMQYIALHPAIKLWYVFWDDFYYQNREMDIVKANEDDFNPINASSICYRVLKREDLEKWLEKRNMMGAVPNLLNTILFRSILFNESNLDVLYQRIGDLQNPDLVAIKV